MVNVKEHKLINHFSLQIFKFIKLNLNSIAIYLMLTNSNEIINKYK